MAYIECDISSISLNATTLSTSATAPIVYYGSLFGATGYWIRLPGYAKPIGEMPTGTTLSTVGWGALLEAEGSTTGPDGRARARTPVFLTIAAYRQGTRWFRITNTGLNQAVSVLVRGVKRKRLKVWYRSTDELIQPAN